MEDLLVLRPDVIIAPENHGADAGTSLAAYQAPPLNRSIPAARSGRMHTLPADLLFRPSPRGLAALEMLFPLLFPDEEISAAPGGVAPGNMPESRETGS